MAKTMLESDLAIAAEQVQIREQVGQSVTEDQRKAMLERHLAAIEAELGVTQDERTQVINKFKDALKGKQLSEVAQKAVDYELRSGNAHCITPR